MADVKKGRTSLASRTLTLAVGDEAPDFSLVAHAGETCLLSQFRGQKNVVVMFLSSAFSSV
ncbi:MAG: redoxin domain-containing protein [Chloroflexi bacterium]|nr:redoxin domain-containing protein [Chloroflexota bacterium]MCL5107462.1 redoxin domain-containing protein [Chloroflexota bacterium]